MRSCRWLAACFCWFLWMASASAQTVVFEEKFFGDGDPLSGKTPDTTTYAEKWQAGGVWGDDGIHFSPTTGKQAAHLDYVPQPGRVYTASTRVRNSHANAFGFGFMPGDSGVEPALQAHADTLAFAWIQTANSPAQDQQAFLGPGVGLPQTWNGDLADTALYIEFDIILDTTGPNWTVLWLVNNTPQGTPVAFDTPGNPGIGGVGMSRDIDTITPSSFAETSYFRLTYTAVPEPTSMTMFALGGWMLARRRR